MPLSNADNPAAEPMSPIEDTPPAAVPTSASSSPAPAQLTRASSSGSAEVHNLLAEREIAVSNGDTDHVAAVDAKLTQLGFTI